MNTRSKKPTIDTLYPDLTDEERSEAEFIWQRYINLVWHIYNHTKRDSHENIDEKPFKR